MEVWVVLYKTGKVGEYIHCNETGYEFTFLAYDLGTAIEKVSKLYPSADYPVTWSRYNEGFLYHATYTVRPKYFSPYQISIKIFRKDVAGS